QIAAAIDQDRQTLIEVMEALDLTRNPVKTATAWVTEKAHRLRFGGTTSGDRELGNFLALEAISLGVQARRSLWMVLRDIAPGFPELASFDSARMAERAEAQRRTLEVEKMRAAYRALDVRAVVTP